MAAKESRGLPDGLKQSFNFGKPRTDLSTTSKPESNNEAPNSEVLEDKASTTVNQAEVTEVYKVNEVSTANTSISSVTSKNKGGRPRGIEKVKKTLYLTTGMEDLKTVQLDLAARARTFIKEESDIVDLALAFLVSEIQDQEGLDKFLALYRNR